MFIKASEIKPGMSYEWIDRYGREHIYVIEHVSRIGNVVFIRKGTWGESFEASEIVEVL